MVTRGYVWDYLKTVSEAVYDENMPAKVREFWSDDETKNLVLSFLANLTVKDGSGRWNIVRAITEADLPEDDPDVRRLRKLREDKIQWVTSQNLTVAV